MIARCPFCRRLASIRVERTIHRAHASSECYCTHCKRTWWRNGFMTRGFRSAQDYTFNEITKEHP